MRESTMWATQGGPIIGEIRNGKKYPFGTVPATEYDADMQALRTEISGLNSAVVSCQGDLAGLTTALDILSGQYGVTVPGLSQAVTDIRVQIAEVNAALTAVTNTQNIDRSTLTSRIENAENSISALRQTLESFTVTFNNQISGLRSEITVNSQEIAVIKSTLQTQGAAIAAADADIDAVESRMNAQEVGMATLRQQLLNSVTLIENEIEQVVTDKAAIKSDLAALTAEVAAFRADTMNALSGLNERVTALEGGGEALEILSFTASPDICELGGHENIILNWTIQGTAQLLTINGEPVTGTTKTIANVMEPTTYTLEARNAAGVTVQKTVSIAFVNHVFFGTSASAIATEGVVKGLDSSDLSDDRAREFTVSPYREYIYYAYPKRLGTSEFIVNDFKGGFEEPVIVAMDNHSEFTEDYYVYRSANKLSSTFTVHVI